MRRYLLSLGMFIGLSGLACGSVRISGECNEEVTINKIPRVVESRIEYNNSELCMYLEDNTLACKRSDGSNILRATVLARQALDSNTAITLTGCYRNNEFKITSIEYQGHNY